MGTVAASTAPAVRTRGNSRRDTLLDAAARLFRAHGYHGTSVREIAKAIDATPGALYSHYPSKADLLLAVYREGVRRIVDAVDSSVTRAREPVPMLIAACSAHLTALLEGGDYASVVVRVLPGDVEGAEAALLEVRDNYERRFKRLIALAVAPPQRTIFRLALLGTLNAVPTWYHQTGKLRPPEIARNIVLLLMGARKS